VEFEGDQISLDIPREGITVGGWKLSPLIPPVVSMCAVLFTLSACARGMVVVLCVSVCVSVTTLAAMYLV
jgi:hypothetical protein